MTDRDFTTTVTVDQSPEEAFAAILNVRDWWSQNIVGPTDKAGAKFDYRFQDVHHCRIKVAELVPGKRVAWRVLENYFSFTHDKTEWTGTDIVFDISQLGDRTEVRLTHIGLVPEYECYEACQQGWTQYIGVSLRDLIVTGKGSPNVGEAMTEKEMELAS